MIYEEVFRELQAAGVRYLVVGGVAINLYGILRTTADLDLMVYLEDGLNVERFIGVMKKLGYRPRAPVPLEQFADPAKRKLWREEKGAVVFTFLRSSSYEQIDVFLHDPIDFPKAYERRRIFKIESLEISAPGLADFKSMKRLAGREKDLADLKHLGKLEDLDREQA